MEDELNVLQFQDLGDLGQTLRTPDETGPAGVDLLLPDENKAHAEALREIRAVVDEYYGESIERFCGEDEKVVIERATFRSDDLPYIEYRVVDSRDEK